jgi:hypothetical protein
VSAAIRSGVPDGTIDPPFEDWQMSKKTSGKSSPTKKRATTKPAARRVKWLDAKSNVPQIEGYARQMKSYLAAMTDGVIDKDELKKQEKKLVSLMKKIEPQLDDELHRQVTDLLCEITVYDIMRMLAELHDSRPESTFRG